MIYECSYCFFFFLIFIPMTGGVDQSAVESKLSFCNVSPCGVRCYSCKAASSNVSCYWSDGDSSRVYAKRPRLFRDNRIRGKVSSFLQRLHHPLSHIWRPCTRCPSPWRRDTPQDCNKAFCTYMSAFELCLTSSVSLADSLSHFFLCVCVFVLCFK